MLNSQIVDDVRYAEVSDVSVYIRNKTFDSNSDPTKTQVQRLIEMATDLADNRMWRAWRTRQVQGLEKEVETSHEQEPDEWRILSGRGATRLSSRGTAALMHAERRRAVLFLPHRQLRDWDTAQDQLEILKSDSVDDITSKEGRDVDGGYVVNERNGIIRIDLSNFIEGPLRRGTLEEPPLVRVTYRYGNDESANDPANGGDGVSDSVPAEVQMAVAKMVAADIIHTDQMGSVITSGPENVPDQSTAAGKLWSGAMNTIEKYARRPIL